MQTMWVFVLRLMVQIALLLLVARYLGPEDYGEFAGIAALAFAVGTMSSFGLGFLVLSESAKSSEAGNSIMAFAVPATLFSAALMLPFYIWLTTAAIGSQAGLLVLVLIGLSELLLVPLLGLLSFRLHGLGYVAFSQALLLWPMALRLAGLLLCMALLQARHLEIYAWVHSLGALAAIALAATLERLRTQWPNRLHWPGINVIRNGVRYAVMNLTAMSPSEVDKALALRLLGAGDTGMYALASRGLSVVTLPVAAMLQAALPRLIRDLHGSRSAGYRLLSVTLALSGLYGLSAAVLLYLAVPPLLEWLLEPGYRGIGSVVAKIAFIAPFLSLRIATGATLFALGLPLLRSIVEGGAIMLLIMLAVILAPRFGVTGIIWSVGVSEMMMAMTGIVILSSHLRYPRQSIQVRESMPGNGHV